LHAILNAVSLPRSRKRRLAKILLVTGSLAFAGLIGEGVLRVTGHYRLFSLRLAPVTTGAPAPGAVLDIAPEVVRPFVAHWKELRPDLDGAWLRTSPAPLPRPPALGRPPLPQRDWLLHYYVANAALLRAMWVKGKGLPMLPGLDLPEQFDVFDPPGGKPTPRYRYPSSRTLPTGLVTNAFGFRGRELTVDKPARTVRIGFVGASTTVEAHGLPQSAPELVEHWLNLWAANKHLDVKFETLNAAREAIQSPDIRAIVEDELLPLEIDYLVYYEGANQLQPATMQKHVQVEGDYQLAEPPAGLVGAYDDTENADSTWLDGLASWCAAARYLRSALHKGEQLVEPPKPTQHITLSPDLMRGEFPLDRASGVLELSAIGQDLEAIRVAVERSGARLVLSTFWWLAKDGMVLDAVWGKNVHVHINRAYWPFRYSTVRDFASVQNRFFASWAKAHSVDLLDVAGELPQEPALAIDAIHQNELGVRLKAWVMFADLTRILERDLASGRLPVADRHPDAVHPNIGAVRVLTRAELDGR
jgi:hypothetical protein